MIDPRYEHAQSSNQGGGRGWNFYDPKPPVIPAPKSRKDTPLWVALLALIGGPAVMFLAAVMLT